MKFKIGDRVKVKRYYGLIEDYPHRYGYNHAMDDFLNGICEIIKISDSGKTIEISMINAYKSFLWPYYAVEKINNFSLPNHLFEI